MEELKLYVVTFGGPEPCFRFQAAKNAEEAFLQCFNKHTVREGHDKASCKVEEAKVEGYNIVLRPAGGQK